MRAMLQDPGFWLAVYLVGGLVTAVNTSVDHRMACDRLNDLNAIRSGCLPGSAVLAGLVSGAIWPLYVSHEALYAWRAQ